MPHAEPRDPNVPPRENQDDVEETINPESEVDEASFESFPASDAPGSTGQRVGPADVPDPDDASEDRASEEREEGDDR